MKRCFCLLIALVAVLSLNKAAAAQGDVRSATGMPIPIGAPVIWGQVELRGLRSDETRPTVVVTLMFNGAQVATAQANDKGYYYFIQTPRDGSELAVSVGGTEIGRQVITSAGGERYDMVVNWTDGARNPRQAGVVSVKNAYTARSDANNKLFDRASAAAKGKNSSEAIKLFRELVASDANDFVAWTELGSIYFEQSKFSEAQEAYDRALTLKPDFMVALMNQGKLHMANKQYDKAIPVLEKAVAADKTSADAYHYLGESYLQAKLGSKAVVVLNEAIRLAPVEKAEIHLRLAALYNAAGLKDRAVAEYKMFLEKKPDHSERSKLEKYIKENSK